MAQIEVQLSEADLELIAQKTAQQIMGQLPRNTQPFFTLDELARLSGMSIDSWQRVLKNYPGYFVRVGRTPIIRAADLDELLELNKGWELTTQAMSEADKQKLAARKKARSA